VQSTTKAKRLSGQRLAHLRQVEQLRRALRPGGAERPHLPRPHLLDGLHDRGEHQVEPPGHQVCHRRRAAAVGDLGEAHAGPVLEQRRREVLRAAGPGDAAVQPAWVGLGMGDQLRDAPRPGRRARRA
jgi:hypothetical protein